MSKQSNEVAQSTYDTIPIPITYESSTKDSDDNVNNQPEKYNYGDGDFEAPSNRNYE